MQAISAKYLPPTDHKPARIKVRMGAQTQTYSYHNVTNPNPSLPHEEQGNDVWQRAMIAFAISHNLPHNKLKFGTLQLTNTTTLEIGIFTD